MSVDANHSPDRIARSKSELDAAAIAAAAGDQEATAAVLTTIWDPVHRYCAARLGSAETAVGSADDVTQEVVLALLGALPRYEDRGRPFMAFVYRIAGHKVADALRARKRFAARIVLVDRVHDAEDLRPTPEETVMTSDVGRRLGSALADLPIGQRTVVKLRVIDGMTAEETATAVRSTVGAVRVAQHRGLQRMRRAIEDDVGAMAG